MPVELNFNAADYDPSSPIEPVPAGWYRAHVVASDMKPTKDKAGAYLQLEFAVLDEGPYKGRKFWDRLNLKNANETTVKIAQAQLSALCHAVGKLTPKNSAELHHIPVMVRVTVKQQTGYEPANEVKGYKGAEGVASIPLPKSGTTAAGAAAVSTMAAPASAAAPSWAKKSA